MPGSWMSGLGWSEMADGEPWVISEEEMNNAGVKFESVRVYAHEYARNASSNGDAPFKFKTKLVEGDLYLQAMPTVAEVKDKE